MKSVEEAEASSEEEVRTNIPTQSVQPGIEAPEESGDDSEEEW